MNTFLTQSTALLTQQCPFLVVSNTGGVYQKTFINEFTFEFEEEKVGITTSGSKNSNLKSKKVAVLSGGTIQALDENYLRGQQNSLLQFAVSAMAQQFHIEAMTATSVLKKKFSKPLLDNDLLNISIYGTEDTRLLVPTAAFMNFRSAVTPQFIIPNPQSHIICSKNLYDHSFPLIIPAGKYLEIIAYRYDTSFVVSDLTFSLTKNILYFEFKYDLQDTAFTIVYSH